MSRLLLVLALGASVVAAAFAADRADLDGTRILGNRELPKVLYVVPWKTSRADETAGSPVSSVLDEVLVPVDREVFRRELEYYRRAAPTAADKH